MPSAKLTIMNGVWANELFTPRDGIGETASYGRQLHSFWITGNENAQMVPSVLEAWEVSEDGLTWNLRLRKGIKFHNGEDLTMEDALFTAEFVFGPESVEKSLSPSVAAEAADTVSIEALDLNTLQITHVTPKAFFPFSISELSFAITGVVLPKDYFESVGQDGYNKAPIGAGPFRLLEHKVSEQMLFESFEDYFNPARSGNFDTLDMRLVPEVSTRVAALRAGEADLIEANLTVRDQVEAGGGRMIFADESSYMWMILPNCDRDVFCNDKKVRQALDYAIDKDLIIEGLYGPEAAQSKGWVYVTPNALGYSSDLDPFPFDVAKAQQLLSDAGYPDGAGFPSFKIHTWSAGDLPFLPEQAQLIADMWQKNLNLDVGVSIGDAATTRDAWYAGNLAGDVLLRANEARWDGGTIVNALYGDFDGRAHIGGKRDDLQAAVDKALDVVDPNLRQAAFNELYKILHDEHYEFGNGFVNLPWAAGPRIKAWSPWPVVPYQTALWTIELN